MTRRAAIKAVLSSAGIAVAAVAVAADEKPPRIWDARNFIFAIPERMKPFLSTLPGRARMRFRNDDFATVAIRHEGKTRVFILVDQGTHFAPALDLDQGANVRA